MAAGTRAWGKVCAQVKAERRPCWLHAHDKCKFKGAPIDYHAHHLDSRSFSGDHITPSSRGGLDTYENCGATHRGCNCARHDDNVEPNTRSDDW